MYYVMPRLASEAKIAHRIPPPPFLLHFHTFLFTFLAKNSFEYAF